MSITLVVLDQQRRRHAGRRAPRFVTTGNASYLTSPRGWGNLTFLGTPLRLGGL